MSKPPTSAFGRVMARTVWTEGGCLEFVGSRDGKGYGMVSDAGFTSPQRTHRVVWRHFHGELPSGMAVLHRCDNPPCVNVFHLFIGTIADNNRDMANKGRQHWQRKTHCPSGHSYREHGSSYTNSRTGRSVRVCLICRREAKVRYRAKVSA